MLINIWILGSRLAFTESNSSYRAVDMHFEIYFLSTVVPQALTQTKHLNFGITEKWKSMVREKKCQAEERWQQRKKKNNRRTWLHIFIIPALERLRHKDCQNMDTSLSYKVRLMLSLCTEIPSSHFPIAGNLEHIRIPICSASLDGLSFWCSVGDPVYPYLPVYA